ncbi:MAG: restriction endonuclease subunit S [Rhodobacteraceae bacterium]|nr:restriction endonuclease subunit S [Paracoccaceae bacterium]
MTEFDTLPQGWLRLPLGDAVRPRGEKASPTEFPDYPFLGMDHVEAQTGRLIGQVPAGSMKSAAARFKAGDVLYGRLRPYLNKVARPTFDGLASAEFMVFPENGFVLNSYLMHRLRSRDFVSFSSHLNEGDRPRVDFNQIGTFPIEVPPIPEQHRIVAKIEALFSELDAGQDSLTRAQAQLKLYRQSLLKAAFQGRLTADWRKANAGKLEPPETLLSRVRTEREARYKQALDDWQTALAEWRAGGEVGRKPAKPKRPIDVHEPDTDALDLLPDLPEGWAYIHLAHLGDLARGKSRHRPRNDPKLFGGPYPFVQTGEVKAAGRKIRTYSATYSEFGLSQSRLWPAGTLCITIAANIAETAFLDFDGCFPDSVVGFTAYKNVVQPEFIECFIKAAKVEIAAYAPATAQKNINLTTLEELIVPYCGQAEQQEISSRLDAAFSSIDAIETEITTALAKLSALRQSILKKAFSGQLVPQDPSDEPASALLTRLRHTTPTPRRKTKA